MYWHGQEHDHEHPVIDQLDILQDFDKCHIMGHEDIVKGHALLRHILDGEPVTESDYQRPREFLVSLGLRF